MTIFIDISGAFDNTSTEVILRSARVKKIPEWTCEWLENMLRNRRISAACEHCKNKIAPTRGYPQGGCLSPLLWCLVIDSLLCDLDGVRSKIVGYADDIAISLYGEHLEGICTTMNKAMAKVERWCNDTGLSVNPSKTELVVFNGKREEVTVLPRAVKLFNVDLKISGDVKYLGVYLDSRLNMKRHFSEIASRANKAFWAARALGSRHWGMKPRMLKYIYAQIMLPRILYGSIVFWHKLVRRHGNGKNLEPLEKIQRMAALMITGAMKTTPSTALYAITGLKPIDSMVVRRAIECYNRLNNCGTWVGDVMTARHATIEKEVERLKIKGATDDVVARWFAVRSFETYSNRTHHKTAMNYVNVYTDASVAYGRAGAGVSSEDLQLEWKGRLRDGTGIVMAETCAITAAAKLCLEENIMNKRLSIWTDSRESINALEKGLITSRTVIECLETLNRLTSRNLEVALRWLPKKERITGHVEADNLARAATYLPIVQQLNPINREQVKVLLDEWITS